MRLVISRGLLAVSLTFAALGNAYAADLDSETKKLSYTFGLDIGRSLKNQGDEIDLDVLFEAIRTGYDGAEAQMTAEEIQAFRSEFIQKRQAQIQAERARAGEANKAEGAAFLAQNRKKEGVIETTSGLQYEVMTTGDGPRPSAEDTVTVHYAGTLLNGDSFDSSYDRGAPATFGLSGVIPGWTEGLQLMPVGSKYKFYIPYELAYGEDGRDPVIPPAALLVFEVELLEIK